MLIDFHTHVFPDKIAKKTIDILAEKSNGNPCTDGTVDGLINAMEKADADICITLPVLTKPSQFESVARFSVEINEKFKNEKRRLISFGGIHPDCEDIDGKMKFLKNQGVIGVKIHPDYQDKFIDDDGYIRILECAKEYDMIVVTHAGMDDGYKGEPVKCPPQLVKNVIKKVKHSKFVLAHYGGNRQWKDVFDIIAGEDVYLDTAFALDKIDENLFKRILDKHGSDKVLFATDCPWGDMELYSKILKTYNLSKDVLDKIMYKNALKLIYGE